MNQAEVRRRQVEAFSEILMMITTYVICNLIGDHGVTYVVVALEFCMFVWAFVCGGIPDALGRLLRRRRNKGQYKNAHRMRKSAVVFQLIIGFVGSMLLLLFAGHLAEGILGIKYSTLLIKVLSPIVLFRAISTVLLGYCQGEGLELPIAIVGILRQALVLVFAALLVGKLKPYGIKVSNFLMQEHYAGMYNGLGIVISILMAEIICIIFLLLIYKVASGVVKKDRQDGLRSTDSYFDCIRGIWLGRWQTVLLQAFLCMPILVAVFFMKNVMEEDVLLASFSLFISKYGVIILGLISLIFALSLPSLGKVFTFIRKDDKRFARTSFEAGVHITLVHGIFFGIIVSAMAPQLTDAFGIENGELLLKLFQIGSALIVFGALCRYFGRFLSAAGKIPPMLCAVIVSVVICSVLFGIIVYKNANILALLYSILAGILVLTFLLGFFAHQLIRGHMDWLRGVIFPLLAGCITGLIGFFVGKAFTPHLGNLMTVFVVFLISLLVYWTLLLLLRTFREPELDVIAGGHLIHSLGQLFRVF